MSFPVPGAVRGTSIKSITMWVHFPHIYDYSRGYVTSRGMHRSLLVFNDLSSNVCLVLLSVSWIIKSQALFIQGVYITLAVYQHWMMQGSTDAYAFYCPPLICGFNH